MYFRLDNFVMKLFSEKYGNNEFSRTNIQNFIKNNAVKINKKVINKPSYKVDSNDIIDIDYNLIDKFLIEKNQINILKPKEIKIDIVFGNENLMVINKPVGLTVHPGAGNINNTLVNGLLFLEKNGRITLSNERGGMRLGIVHRLDKDTSGLMIVAKNNKSHRLLSELLKKHLIDRRYLALCHGIPFPYIGTIDNYICRDNKNIKKMKICNQDDKNAKRAITNYRVLKIIKDGKYSLVECKLETGRTHQIRLHMYNIKHPLVGEQLYSTKNIIMEDINNNFCHQMLHSYKLLFNDPINGEKIDLELLNEEFNL